ncbi:hypothetical protein IAT38_002935 [Cryptococcus sp. DSM 104549]
MSHPGEEIEQDLSHIHWSWPEAVAANGAQSLATADLAMDYFAYSPFWDGKSNNNVLRTQRRIENPAYGHAEEKIELNAFNAGFEYIVAHSQPPNLFVIHRREVEETGRRDRVTGAWFILHEKIYQCPTMFDVVATRLRNASSLISRTLGTLSENRPPANPRTTTIWRSLPPSQPTATQPTPSPSAQRQDGEEDSSPRPESGEPSEPAESGAGTTSTPDWRLFNALASTRSAMASLDTLARTPVKPAHPREELRNLEAQIGAQMGAPQGGGQGLAPGQGPGQRALSTRSVSVTAPGMSVPPWAGAGLTPMPMTGAGGSPAPGMTPGVAGSSPMKWLAQSQGIQAAAGVGAGAGGAEMSPLASGWLAGQ